MGDKICLVIYRKDSIKNQPSKQTTPSIPIEERRKKNFDNQLNEVNITYINAIFCLKRIINNNKNDNKCLKTG